MKALRIVAVAALLAVLLQPSSAESADGTAAKTSKANKSSPANSDLQQEMNGMKALQKTKEQNRKMLNTQHKLAAELAADGGKGSKVKITPATGGPKSSDLQQEMNGMKALQKTKEQNRKMLNTQHKLAAELAADGGKGSKVKITPARRGPKRSTYRPYSQ